MDWGKGWGRGGSLRPRPPKPGNIFVGNLFLVDIPLAAGFLTLKIRTAVGFSIRTRNMVWIFRKSINLGLFRITFSKTGMSFSLGAGGFRTGINTKGRRYTSIGIPGTGVRYHKYHKK